ncbi:MAG TPA: site-specific integrase [Acidimicrobiia bacterium]
MSFMECVSVSASRADVVDRYVEFVAGRCRPNTVIATASDLRVFFSVIDRPPAQVSAADVFEFIAAQRRGPGDGRVVRLADGESGLAARTIKRRLASVSGLFNYLVLTGEMAANPGAGSVRNFV